MNCTRCGKRADAHGNMWSCPYCCNIFQGEFQFVPLSKFGEIVDAPHGPINVTFSGERIVGDPIVLDNVLKPEDTLHIDTDSKQTIGMTSIKPLVAAGIQLFDADPGFLKVIGWHSTLRPPVVLPGGSLTSRHQARIVLYFRKVGIEALGVVDKGISTTGALWGTREFNTVNKLFALGTKMFPNASINTHCLCLE